MLSFMMFVIVLRQFISMLRLEISATHQPQGMEHGLPRRLSLTLGVFGQRNFDQACEQIQES